MGSHHFVGVIKNSVTYSATTYILIFLALSYSNSIPYHRSELDTSETSVPPRQLVSSPKASLGNFQLALCQLAKSAAFARANQIVGFIFKKLIKSQITSNTSNERCEQKSGNPTRGLQHGFAAPL